jgi:hypothetical protein
VVSRRFTGEELKFMPLMRLMPLMPLMPLMLLNGAISRETTWANKGGTRRRARPGGGPRLTY